MAARADIWLGIHDASRIEWIAELPLPERGEREVELELSLEIPGNVWVDHDHWERLQLMARLSSPSDEGTTGEAPRTVDELRRATLGAAGRSKDARDRIEKEIFRATALFADDGRADGARAIADDAAAALAELRGERDRLAAPVAGEPEELTRQRRLAAEYLSNHAIEFLSTVQRAVDDQLAGPRALQRAALEEPAARLRGHLAALLAEELAYRERMGFLRPDGADPWRLERYVSRASQLKKHFQEVLFLELEAERSDRRFRNWFGVIAASLAALWAFPAAMLLTGGSGITGLGLGLSTTLALLVASYAVKDRIKESVRTWLASRVEQAWGGRLTELTAPARLLGAPFRLARMRESFFVTREQSPDDLDPDLGSTRPVVRLRYRLRGTIAGDPRLAWHGHERAKFVFRYDLSPLFARLDDPIKEVPVLSEDGKALRFAEAARCYRIPVSLELRHGGVTQRRAGVIVTHKLGLERLERRMPVASDEASPAEAMAAPLASIHWASLRRR